MSKAIGIDLGNTKSVVACLHPNGPRVIDNWDSSPITPSVVHLDESLFPLVGESARTAGIAQPESTIFSVKRFLGRDFDDPDLQAEIHRSPARIFKSADGGVEFELRGRRFTPQEITAFILETLKKTRWNQKRAAAELGIGETTLWRKIKKFDLRMEDT